MPERRCRDIPALPEASGRSRRGLFLFVCVFLLCLATVSPAAEPDPAKEVQLGAKVARQVEERWERIADPSVSARLDMICSRLTPYMKRDLPYEVRCVREKSPNAFSLPGGFIYMTSGMMEFLHSDAEIASVIAHELVHSDRRHAMIQAARSQRLSILTLGAIVLSGGSAAPIILANLLQTAITNSYSIDLEREADLVGLNVLVSAGYPPAAMLTVMEGLAEEQLKHPYVDLGVMMDHPEVKERIAYLTKIIREKGLPLERKRALNFLIVSVQSEKGMRFLSVDGVEIVRAPDDEKTATAFSDMKIAMDRCFQLELSPSEIQVVAFSDARPRPTGSLQQSKRRNDPVDMKPLRRRGLRVGNTVVFDESLPGAEPSLELIRARLLDALLRAQTRHPIARYLN